MSVIHIVYISDMNQPITSEMTEKLPGERTTRAWRYRQNSDRLRCISAGLLAEYAAEEHFGCLPEKLRLFMSEGMPPYAVMGNEKCYMSISHTSCYVMCMTDMSECGADIESINSCACALDIGDRYFCGDEADWIRRGSSDADKAERFTRIWTAKEAYLKYCGTGLRRPLDSFSIAAAEGVPAVSDPLMPSQRLFSHTGRLGGHIYTSFSKTPVVSVRVIKSEVLFCM